MRRRKRKGEGHRRREEILAAAQHLFLAEGYENVTIRKIASAVGVSSAALYLYFADKNAILNEICDEAFLKLIAEFEAIVADEANPLAVLRRMMAAYIHFGLNHPDAYRLVFMAKALGINAYNHRATEFEPGARGSRGPQAFGMLQRQVTLLVERGTLRQDDPVMLTELIWAAGHGLVALLITLPEFPWSERDTLVRAMIDMPLEGLRPRA